MTNNRTIVSNTSPFISLERLPNGNGFQFIRKLYDKIIIPREVLAELLQDKKNKFTESEYLDFYGIIDLIEIQPIQLNENLRKIEILHTTEALAISLAVKLDLALLIEEENGREVARLNNIAISGIAGQIVIAFERKLIEGKEAREMLEVLKRNGRLPKFLCKSLIDKIENQ